MELSCDQLTQEQAKLAGSLMAASDAQRATRRGDTIGIILIGLPTSTIFGGSVTPEIARIKGEIQAVQKAGELKNCNLTPIDVLPPKPQQTSNPDI